MDQVDVRIVEAAPQDLAGPPTEKSARLLPLPNSVNSLADIVLPAALHMLGKSPHYTLAVESNVPPSPDNMHDSFVDVPAAARPFVLARKC